MRSRLSSVGLAEFEKPNRSSSTKAHSFSKNKPESVTWDGASTPLDIHRTLLEQESLLPTATITDSPTRSLLLGPILWSPSVRWICVSFPRACTQLRRYSDHSQEDVLPDVQILQAIFARAACNHWSTPHHAHELIVIARWSSISRDRSPGSLHRLLAPPLSGGLHEESEVDVLDTVTRKDGNDEASDYLGMDPAGHPKTTRPRQGERQPQCPFQNRATSIPVHTSLSSVAKDAHGTIARRNRLNSDCETGDLVVETLSKIENHSTQPLLVETLPFESVLCSFSLCTGRTN